MKFAGFQLHHVILTGVGPAMQRVTECGGRAAGISYDFFLLEFWFEFSRIKSSHNRKLRFPRNYGTMIPLSAFSEIFVALCKLCKFQIHIILLFSAAQLTSDVCCLSEYIYDENNAEFQLDVVIYSKWKFYVRKCSITAGCAFISTFWLSTMIQSIHGSVVTASRILFSFLASKNVNFGRFAKVSCRTDSPEGPV